MTLLSTVTAAPRIAVHGHRGARAVRPENTIPAFRYALEAGVDVLEMDLAVTKDDVLVVSHDSRMNPKYCTGPAGAEKLIRRMTFAELQQWDCGGKANPDFPRQQAVAGTRVPSLDAVFSMVKAAGANVEFNIETKISPARPDETPDPEKFARLVRDTVRKHGLVSRVILQSFDYRTLHAMAKLEPRIRLSALSPVPGNEAARTLADWARLGGASIVSPQCKTVKPAEVAAAQKVGIQVVPWTANTETEWELLIAARVDAIITDDPAALIAYLKKKGLR